MGKIVLKLMEKSGIDFKRVKKKGFGIVDYYFNFYGDEVIFS